LAAYDLGIGYEEYKTHWCDVVHELADGYVAFTAKGALGLGAQRLGQRTKATLQRNDRLWKALKALRSRTSARTAGKNTSGN
jgi:CelD/BcsL family acetyltransferase involved in cellulose biosynthesis